MRTLVLILAALCVMAAAVLAQPTTEWSRTYQLSAYMGPKAQFCKAGDGYALGYTDGDADSVVFELARMQANGDTLWTKRYPSGLSSNYLFGLERTADDGFILIGQKHSDDYPSGDIYIVKTDDDGTVQWTKSFGTPSGSDYIRGIAQTPDGGYIMIGGLSNYQGTQLIRLDSDGDTLWVKPNIPVNGGEVVLCTDDGGYFVSGSFWDAQAAKLDSSGNTIWSNNYSTMQYSWRVIDAIECCDGGFLLVGSRSQLGQPNPLFGLIKIDSDGDTLWTYAQIGGAERLCTGAVETADGKLIVAGNPKFVAKFTENGQPLWFHDMNQAVLEIDAVVETSPHHYAVGGSWFIDRISEEIPAPQLVATRPGVATEMLLRWNDVVPDGVYYIWAKTSHGAEPTLIDSTTEPTYTEAGLQSLRFYQVEARWGGMVSPLSNVAGYLKITAAPGNTPFGLPFRFWVVPSGDNPTYGTESFRPSSIARAQTTCGTISTGDRIVLQGGNYAYRSCIGTWAGTLESGQGMSPGRAFWYNNKTASNIDFVLAGDADTTAVEIPSVSIDAPIGEETSKPYSWRDPRSVARDRLNLLTNGFTGGTISTSDRVVEQGGSYFYYNASTNSWAGSTTQIVPGKAYDIINKHVDNPWTYTYDASGQP